MRLNLLVLKSRLISENYEWRTFFDGEKFLSGEKFLEDFSDEVDEGFEEKLFPLVFAGGAALIVHE